MHIAPMRYIKRKFQRRIFLYESSRHMSGEKEASPMRFVADQYTCSFRHLIGSSDETLIVFEGKMIFTGMTVNIKRPLPCVGSCCLYIPSEFFEVSLRVPVGASTK